MKDAKEKELMAARCLNVHPDRVTCELFMTNKFFDARDLLQVKYEMVRQVRTDKKTIRRAAREFGFSRPSLYKALEAFESAGLTGLLRDKPGPRQAHKINDEVMQFIETQKKENPVLTLPEIVELIKKKFGIVVHKRSIQRVRESKKKRL